MIAWIRSLRRRLFPEARPAPQDPPIPEASEMPKVENVEEAAALEDEIRRATGRHNLATLEMARVTHNAMTVEIKTRNTLRDLMTAMDRGRS